MKYGPDMLLFTVDLAGTFIFAIEGAMAAAIAGLDIFGLMVLSFATALAGGVIRDLLIGAIPPQSIRDWRYPVTAFAGGAVVILLHQFIQRIPSAVIIGFDAAGLSLFAVAGTEKALVHGINPFISTLMGTMTGVGGGTVRDVLLAHIPTVLRADVYATAALAGSAVMLVTRRLGLSSSWSAILGGVVCFALRVVSVWQHWNLPRIAAP